MNERDQNEASGQQPPIGKNDDQIAGQSGPSSSGTIAGTTCQETPNLSLSQPHMLSSPPSVRRVQ